MLRRGKSELKSENKMREEKGRKKKGREESERRVAKTLV